MSPSIGIGNDISIGSVGGFNPFAVGAPFWLADASMGITLATGGVSVYADQSGNGHDLLQATEADRLTLNSADSDFNGNDSVEGDGISKHMQSVVFTAIPQPITVIIVEKYTSLPAGTPVLFDGAQAGARTSMYYSNPDLTLFAGTAQAAHTADTDPHIWVGVFNGASSASYLDGAVASLGGTVGTQGLTGISLFGTHDGTANAPAKSPFGVAYPKVLTSGEINYNCNGLAARFGTTWTNI